MSYRPVDRSKDKPRWEIRVIRWLLIKLREEGNFNLRLGHSLVLENPEPELYLEAIYGDDEVSVFDMTFTPQQWPRLIDTMRDLQWKVEKEYEEVKGDD